MKFTKMHGLGNDYVFLNCMEAAPEELPALARRLSDRRFGVGGDGLICVCPSERADFRMRIFNRDGSEGELCGNGLRCLGKYVHDKGLTGKDSLTVETQAGVRNLELRLSGDAVTAVTVDMCVPKVGGQRRITVNGKDYTGVEISVGNPHFVVLSADPAEVDLPVVGGRLERVSCFPDRVNVEFVRALSRDKMELRVWERGSGETLACGTGACAAWGALFRLGLVDREVTAVLPGGELTLCCRESDGHLLMTGPAVTVFEGELCEGM